MSVSHEQKRPCAIGGIDAPYIGENGEESTKMRIKEVRPGGAAARQRQLCSGMEIRKVNQVAVQGVVKQVAR